MNGSTEQEDDEQERRRDRQMIELLNELRVAIPGVQILFAFLLTVPFSNGWQRTTPFQRDVLFVTLLAATVSVACLIAPSAAHRIRFHEHDRPWLIESASRMLIAGLVSLAFAMVGAVLLIGDWLYHGVAPVLYAVASALLLAGLWFVRPLLRQHRRRDR